MRQLETLTPLTVYTRYPLRRNVWREGLTDSSLQHTVFVVRGDSPGKCQFIDSDCHHSGEKPYYQGMLNKETRASAEQQGFPPAAGSIKVAWPIEKTMFVKKKTRTMTNSNTQATSLQYWSSVKEHCAWKLTQVHQHHLLAVRHIKSCGWRSNAPG